MRVGFLGAGLIATFHSKMIRRSGVEVERAGVYDPDAERAASSRPRAARSPARARTRCSTAATRSTSARGPRSTPASSPPRSSGGWPCSARSRSRPRSPRPRRWPPRSTRSGVTNQVGLILRRSPAFVWARHLVEAPDAGRVMTVVFRDDQYIPMQGTYGSTWRGDRAKAGAGTLLEHSIHDVDMLRFLAGDVTSVSARDAHFHRLDGIEDVMAVSMAFADGGAGTLTSVWHDNLARPSLRRVEVFCERRWVAIDGDDWCGPVTWTDTDGSEGRTGRRGAGRRGDTAVPGSGQPRRRVPDGSRAAGARVARLRARRRRPPPGRRRLPLGRGRRRALPARAGRARSSQRPAPRAGAGRSGTTRLTHILR